MSIDSLKSVPLIVRELLKQMPQIVTKISTLEVALDQKIFADDEVAKVTPIAMESFKHNAKVAKITSFVASVCGVLTLPSFFQSIFLLTKDKMGKSRPAVIALGVASVLFMTIWFKYRNYPAHLAEKALKYLQVGKVNEAIDLIAQGADLSVIVDKKKVESQLLDLSASPQYARAFMYLSLISNNDLANLKYVFLITTNIAVKKIALELGLPFKEVINKNHRVDINRAKQLLDLGAPADLLLHFAKDTATARFAIDKGALTTDHLAMNELFAYACEIKDKELMDYLFKELKAVFPRSDITDYNSWNRDCELQADLKLTEEARLAYQPSQLGHTPFENYLITLQTGTSFSMRLDRAKLAEALEYFGLLQIEAAQLANFNHVDKFFDDMNAMGFRIKKSSCKNMLSSFTRSET